jgi:hypothetical protein
MASQTGNLCVGARNPYALAELIQGTEIKWKTLSCDRSISKLENAFGMPVKRLFDPKYDSPLYTKNIADVINAAYESQPTQFEALSTGSGSSQQRMTYSLISDWQSYTGNYITAIGMAGLNPVQSGRLKNCSLIAAIASSAWTGKGGWYQYTTKDAPVGSSYDLQFFDYNASVPRVKPSSKLLQEPLGNLIYAKSTINECWPSIIEKGYYMSRDRITRSIDNDTPDMEYYNDEKINPTNDPAAVLYQLLHTPVIIKISKTTYGTDYKEPMIWSNLLSISTLGRIPKLKIRYPAVAYTYDTIQPDWTTSTISPKHSYSILGLAGTVDASQNWTGKYIVLRDPWAVTTDPTLTFPDVLTSGTWLGNIDFAKRDGIFALHSDLFPTYFQGYAYAMI